MWIEQKGGSVPMDCISAGFNLLPQSCSNVNNVNLLSLSGGQKRGPLTLYTSNSSRADKASQETAFKGGCSLLLAI